MSEEACCYVAHPSLLAPLREIKHWMTREEDDDPWWWDTLDKALRSCETGTAWASDVD